jgi:inosine triphosphate pyrophosphatase
MKPKPKLIIVTGNTLKFEQLSYGLSEYFDCEQGIFRTYEIQGTPEEIIKDKLTRSFEYFQKPVLVDDTSLHFDYLNGFPGSYIRDFLRCISAYDMGKKFVGSRMKVVARLGIAMNADDFLISEGVVQGLVVDPQIIDPGAREFDVFFQPDGLDQPLINFSPTDVLSYSHRGLALENLISLLNKKGKV